MFDAVDSCFHGVEYSALAVGVRHDGKALFMRYMDHLAYGGSRQVVVSDAAVLAKIHDARSHYLDEVRAESFRFVDKRCVLAHVRESTTDDRAVISLLVNGEDGRAIVYVIFGSDARCAMGNAISIASIADK